MNTALPHDLQQLLEHMHWADALVWRSVLGVPETHTDERLPLVMHHQHEVQWAYLRVWREEGLDLRELSTFADLPAIQRWGRGFYDELRAFLDALEPETLQRTVDFPWAQSLVERWGVARPATFAETVLQLTSHTTYHRGQVNARLRHLGGEPPLTDFIAWVWMGKPEPRWDADALS